MDFDVRMVCQPVVYLVGEIGDDRLEAFGGNVASIVEDLDLHRFHGALSCFGKFCMTFQLMSRHYN